MPATTALTGYSRLHIALHWLVFALMSQQNMFKDASSTAWDRITEGVKIGFNPLVLANVTSAALVMVFVAYHQFVPRDGTLARMRRAQG